MPQGTMESAYNKTNSLNPNFKKSSVGPKFFVSVLKSVYLGPGLS